MSFLCDCLSSFEMGLGVSLQQHGKGKVRDCNVTHEVCHLPNSENFHPHLANEARHQESESH